MTRPFVLVTSLVLALGACQGLKEAMTAHVDVVASAGKQELTVDRLSALLATSKLPVNADIARQVTDLWVDYSLLGEAAANDDSLNAPAMVDSALWPVISQERVAKWHDVIAKSFTGLDTTNLEKRYDAGEMLAARHILFVVPRAATPAQKDSIRRHAEAIRRQVTSANFADMARKYSQDPGSAQRGGDLGLFPKGVMVKHFESAILALKPGEISPVVETQFGFHIIRRSTFPEVKDQFSQAVNAKAMRSADSTYLSKLEASGNVTIKDDAVSVLRGASKDLDAHATDKAVLATSRAGTLTLGRLVRWVDAYPQKAQIEQGLQQAPDSQVLKFVHNVVRNELVLREADSMHVQLDSSEMAGLHAKYLEILGAVWEQLGVSPKELADSGKTAAERERAAAAHVESYLDKLMAQQVRYVDVPQPIETVARAKYQWQINSSGVDRAVERANKERAAADSARAKNRPPSEVPLGQPQGSASDTGKGKSSH
jgi:hypothetical protein